jgi:large subunit ribosomal protein L23
MSTSVLNVLQRPMITERATNLRALLNQYVFRVAANATKRDIKIAVEKIFKVDVLRVRTMRVPGKFRRLGGAKGAHRPDWKKAIVKLKARQEIRAGEEVK